jgi:hypothetical protein
MADRIPLIVNAGANQIQELPAGDSLNGIVNVTATGTIQAEQLTSTDDANIADDLTVGGKIQPSVGSGTGNGIRWAENPGGGTGDAASITYFAETGENTKLKIAVANDADDDIELSTTNGAAVNISANTTSTNKTTGALVVTGGVGISGALHVGGDITAFATSDENWKDNLSPITDALTRVGLMTGYTFTWNDKVGTPESGKPYTHLVGQEDTGLIAQDVEKLGLPGITTTRDNGAMAIRYDRLTAILTEAVKELKKENDDLKTLIKNSSSFANLKSSL